MAKTKTTTKRQTKTKPTKKTTPDDEVKVCRRRSGRRDTPVNDDTESMESVSVESVESSESEESPSEQPEKKERRKVQRRRQIDPTTCERDYTNDEIEFMHALDEYKRANGRMFPTCSEILEVVRDLGYLKIVDGIPLLIEPETSPSEEETELVTAAEFEVV